MISSTLEKAILNAITLAYNGDNLIGTSVNFPSDGYLALFTTMPHRATENDVNEGLGTLGDLIGAVEVPSTILINGENKPTGYMRMSLKDKPFGSHYFTSVNSPAWESANSCFAITNYSAIQFPMATQTWTTQNSIVGFGIYTKSTADVSGDTLTMAGTLDTPKTVDVNNAVAFAAGALKISLTDANTQSASSDT